ncbi:hypothetical protein HDU76_009047, partial [Blyttiomyces sp. JEL0837]
DLESSKLSGSLSSSLTSLTALQTLIVSDNNLQGDIPDLSSLTSLEYLDLALNNFNSFPEWVLGMEGLTVLSVSGNGFTGPFPDISQLTNLDTAFLSRNEFTGSIPSNIGKLTQLRQLSIWANQLTGSIPDSITSCTKLENFYAENNTLSGPIPAGFANISSLKQVDLSFNRLTGPIPQFSSQKALEYLLLNGNALTGSIPTSLTNLYTLKNLTLNDNQLSGPIPTNIGAMISLVDLQLQNNALSGSIPDSLGNARKLETLFLNDNKLTGEFPASLDGLNELQNFKISGNCISGKLPPYLLAKFNGLGDQTSNCGNTSSSSSSSVPIAGIAGGVVGGLVVICLAVFGFLYMKRRAAAAREQSDNGGLPVAVGKDDVYRHAAAGRKVDAMTPIVIPFNNTPAQLPEKSPAYVPNTTPNMYGNTTAPQPYQDAQYNNYNQGSSSMATLPPSVVAAVFTGDMKPMAPSTGHGGLFDMQTSAPPTAYPSDAKSNPMMMAPAMVDDGITGSDVEGMLQIHMGAYIKWTAEQVILWAKEKKFDESFVQALKDNQVDGAMLNSLDRESLKSDLGVADFKTRAAILKSLEALRDHLRSQNVPALSIPVVGGSVGVMQEPPAYNM